MKEIFSKILARLYLDTMEEQIKNIEANDSIQKSIRQLFWMLILIGMAGFLVFWWNTSIIDRQARKITEYRQEVINKVQQINTGINQFAYFTQEYIFLRQEADKGNWKKTEIEEIRSTTDSIWKDDVNYHKDALNVLLSQNEDNILVPTSILYKKLADIQNYHDILFKIDIETSKETKNILQKLNVSINQINKEVKSIVNNQKLAVQADLSSLNLSNTIAGYGILVIFLLVILLVWQGWYRTRKKIRRDVQSLEKQQEQLLGGELPETSSLQLSEFKNLEQYTIELKKSFQRLKVLADQVGAGNFDTNIRVFEGKGVLGNAIGQMRQSLLKIATENEERNWINEGFTLFSDIFQNQSSDSQSFFETVIRNLVDYLGMAQGAIFILHENKKQVGEESYMELQATYAFQKIKYQQKRIEYGEGLIGRAWREKDNIYLTEIPTDYIAISSGLGTSKPKSILIVPLVSDEKIQGVVEIASFTEIGKKEQEFLDNLGESLAATIEKVRSNTENQVILEESREMQEQMKAQEEEMKQNMEQLISVQEVIVHESKNNRIFMDALAKAFLVSELNAKGYYLSVNQLLAKVSGYSQEEIIGNHFSLLLQQRADSVTVKQHWEQIMKGQAIEGQFIRYRKNKFKFWVHEIIYPIANQDGDIEKVITIGYNISKTKEQEEQLKEYLKNISNMEDIIMQKVQETEDKAYNRISKMRSEYQATIAEKDRIISELRQFE